LRERAGRTSHRSTSFMYFSLAAGTWQ